MHKIHVHVFEHVSGAGWPTTEVLESAHFGMGVSESKRSMAQPVVKDELTTAMTKAKDIVAKHAVVVFSKSCCPFCIKAKQLLASLGAKPTVLELDQESDGKEIQSALAEWTGQRTVPNVFIGGKHIGGCDDTTATHKQGKLVPMLKEAGAIA